MNVAIIQSEAMPGIMAAHDVIESLLPLAVMMLVGLIPSRRAPDSRFLANQRWRYRDLVIVAMITTASEWVVTLSGMSSATEMRVWALGYGLVALVTIVSVWGVVRRNHHRPWRALGMDPATALYNTLWSLRIVLGVASMLGAVMLLLSGGRSIEHAAIGTVAPGVAGIGFGDWVAAFFVTVVFAPVAEEVFFRGLAYGPLLRKLGVTGATIGSAALWAFAHDFEYSWKGLLSVSWVFILGIVCAEVYRRRESLVPTLTFHIVKNMVAILIRVGYFGTFAWLFGVSVTFWIISAVLFYVVSRSRATANASS